MRRHGWLLSILILAGCASYPINEPLQRANIETGYRYANVELPKPDDTFIVLTFSGGGSRAAGFSYSVLRELEKVQLADGSRLIDRIDVISSVSGGSFTSMYFGLRGRQGLDDFKTRFLDKDIQGMLFKEAFLNPRNWIRLLSPKYNRIDLATELYDRELFDGKTFADLHSVQAPNHRPFIIANSTELDLGSRFEWTQDQFDPICSDLSKTHVARAVAASSAFPVLLTPVGLRNYSAVNDCQYVMPSWVANASEDIETNASRQRSAIELKAYRDKKRQYLHLMDGGIADNIGLRGTLQAMTSLDTFQMDDPARKRTGYTIQGKIDRREIRRLMVIVVDAGTENLLNFDTKENGPKLPQILSAISVTPMGNFSFDTVQLLSVVMDEYWRRQHEPGECRDLVKGCPGISIPGADQPTVSFYPVILDFSLLKDETLHKDVNDIGTNFSLKPGQLQLLERAAQDLLKGSDAYQQFLQDAGGKVVP